MAQMLWQSHVRELSAFVQDQQYGLVSAQSCFDLMAVSPLALKRDTSAAAITEANLLQSQRVVGS
jgi:hypothetical protein